MSLRFQIVALIYMMTSVILSALGTVAILLKPRLATHAAQLVPAAIVVSLLIAAPLAWCMALRLITRFSREHSGADPES
jgi:hypothetical protein